MKGALITYIRLINYLSNALTTDGTSTPDIVTVMGLLDTSNIQFIKVSAYSADVEQTLNIGLTINRCRCWQNSI